MRARHEAMEVVYDTRDVARLPPGLKVPRAVEVTTSNTEGEWERPQGEVKTWSEAELVDALLLNHQRMNLSASIRFAEGVNEYRVVKLVVEAIDDESLVPELTSTLIRAIPVQRLLSQATRRLISFEDDGYYPASIANQHPVEWDRARTRGPSERILWSVAHIYVAAEIRKDNPAREVGDHFGLQPRTASNWIRRARESGMFGEFAPGANTHG